MDQQHLAFADVTLEEIAAALAADPLVTPREIAGRTVQAHRSRAGQG